MQRRRLWCVAAALAVLMLVFGLWLGYRWGGAFATRAVDDLGLLGFALAAIGCSLRAAQKGRGRQRHSWLALGLGLGAWTIGDSSGAITSSGEVLTRPRSPHRPMRRSCSSRSARPQRW